MNASFMKPLKTEAKEYCRKGHELERPFLEQLFEQSRAGLTARYASPLVASTSSTTRGVLDSADVKVLCVDNTISTSDSDSDSEDDGSDVASIEIVIRVEIKSRLSHTTFFSERHQVETLQGARAWQYSEPVYKELDATDPALYDWVPKSSECFQLLHHVCIRDSKVGLILVGNSKKVMFGVFVRYSEAVKAAYRRIFTDVDS